MAAGGVRPASGCVYHILMPGSILTDLIETGDCRQAHLQRALFCSLRGMTLASSRRDACGRDGFKGPRQGVGAIV